jgi:cysteine synthase
MRSSQGERNWFIEQLQQFAQQKGIRITFLSGDVHCAAVGVLKTLQKGKKSSGLAPASDHRYMLNVVTSTYAI